ncbi:hypothetical protein Q0590_33795 [Rhodocytophaga aerolata]|uniref:Uncharacterized protein n=1 Tax=Rhodocytophaga aerolata TaxID=455078 RepID=A0ABT8RGR2_9BACT|nr:hypothetical protein [Rhodocytophaga aerolata]MDO1451297.1 hypothetical protein [Rhodocytophaga aerolata]
MKKISLENIERFTIPLEEHPLKWMFLDEEQNNHLREEYKAQIFPLDEEASVYLWNAQVQFKIFSEEFFTQQFFQHNESFYIGDKTDKEIKKWLYQRGIPFSQKVFIAFQPSTGFVLTWKMVIKFWDGLFFSDQAVWDRTLNWGFVADHNDVFLFGRNRVYNSDMEAEKIYEQQQFRQEIENQIKQNQAREVIKYFPNPYLK